MKQHILAACALAAFGGWAACDQPDVLSLGDTGYHTNGWFTLGASVSEEKGAAVFKRSLLFDSKEEFVLSPRYPAAVRKVVVCAHPSSANPTRKFWVRPFVGGIETSTNEFACCLVGTSVEYETVSFDFSPEAGVDAFRLCMSDGGSGNWRLARVLVFYGDKAADEDDILREFAQELPTPANLRAETFTASSLTLAADAVEGAVGYRFAVDRLEGLPRTEGREDFVAAPALSTGWTYGETNGVALGQYTGSGYYDSKMSTDKVALKVEPRGASGSRLEILSPLAEEPIAEYSFMCRASKAENSWALTVLVRLSGEEIWRELADPVALTGSSALSSFALPADANVRQIKFVLAADAGNSANAALDTLRIVYGGNEARFSVQSGDETFVVPSWSKEGLAENARYAFRVQAVADSAADVPCRDSSWSDEQVVDLSWAAIEVAPPTDVAWEMNGAKMTVRWAAVAGADHYLVDVVPLDDPDSPVVSAAKAAGTSLDVTVPSVGEYAVTVTAVSPGGISTAPSESLVDEVELGALASVSLKAVDRQAVEASWTKVPLAEGYQAKLVAVGGSAETFEFGWPVDESGRCVPPDGWTCDQNWTNPAAANTWTNNHVAYPALPYDGSFLASDVFAQPITKVTCAYKCGSSSKGILENTRFVLSVKKADDAQWTEVENLAVRSATDTVKLTFAAEEDVRQIRLEAREVSPFGSRPNVRLGKLTVVAGAETRSEVESVRTTETKVSFRNLDQNGRYAVTVVPLPSEGEALGATSPTVDLSAERFRQTGAVPLSKVREGAYVEAFDSLSNVSAKVETRALPLDYWQLDKGSGEADVVLYSSKTSFTSGGVYVLSDEARTPASFMLGTLAAGTYGCSLGIAFWNDTEGPVGVGTLSFDTVQRTFKSVPKSYVLEWTVTAGATSIDAESEWQALTVPATAPYMAGDPEAAGEYRQTVEIAEGLPAKIPVGCVLILRWRHEKVTSGPAMGIDNVRLEVNKAGKGFGVIVR